MLTSDEEIALIPECRNIKLSEPLQVNISESGDYNDAGQLTPSELPAGERVRGYLMHYFPTEKVANRISGSVTFDQPVVGLIVLHVELVSSSRLGRLRAGEPQPRRQLELTRDIGDRITLSQDRRTVTVELSSPGKSADLVRVIVESNQDSVGGRIRRRRNKRRSNR